MQVCSFDLSGRTALIAGASSGLGEGFARLLAAAGARVVLGARRVELVEGIAADLRAAGVADVIIGDFSQPDLISRALKGVEKVYYVCPGIHPLEREIGIAWIDAAKAEGVKHFVFSSVLHAVLTDLVQHEIKRDVEEYLLSSGLEFTILQPM